MAYGAVVDSDRGTKQQAAAPAIRRDGFLVPRASCGDLRLAAMLAVLSALAATGRKSLMESLNYAIGMAGTAAFAVTAVLAVAPKGIDLFGVCVMGIVTAIGGGTLRDIILNVPVFWAADLNYIWTALAASVLAFAAQPLFTRKEMYALLLYIDGFAVALFAIQAADKVWVLQFGVPLAPILLGIITAIGGGLIRDLLAGRQNLLMSREIYAVPVLFGCTLFVVAMSYFPQHRSVSVVACVLCIFGFRAAAIHWGLRVPECLSTRAKMD